MLYSAFNGDERSLTTDIDTSIQQLMDKVGDRVRRLRQGRHFSRRELSELSGVSPRYLAQLEMGRGNISIALLQKIALALETDVEWLVSESGGDTEMPSQMLRLFNKADDQQRARIIQILQGGTPSRTGRIALIGLRGAGKSTLGPMIAHEFDLPFAELNAEVEKSSGMPVSEVMALYGPEGYRRLERQALERLCSSGEPLVLAVAGGIVEDGATYQMLLSSFHTVWLRATPEDHMERVRSQGDERPMAGNPMAMQQLRSILTSREALYAEAEAAIETSGRSVKDCFVSLAKLIDQHQFLEEED